MDVWTHVYRSADRLFCKPRVSQSRMKVEFSVHAALLGPERSKRTSMELEVAHREYERSDALLPPKTQQTPT